jgi:ppGpp synthetase/RelA/SpoT-type nucleotidyltranferase
MKKLFQTLCVLLAISSQADANTAKNLDQDFGSNQFLSFAQPTPDESSAKHLAKLYGVQTFQSAQIKQPYAEFEQLYQQAIAGQSELETIAARIAAQSDSEVLSSGVKSKLRAIDKINTKLAGKSEKITDLARTSIVAKDIATLMDAFALFNQQTEVVRIKNRFITPGASGYRDLSLLVRLPDSQIIAEVQLHLEAFSEIKNGKEHQNYEQIQHIERMQLTDNRPLSEIELAAISKLRKESQLLYQQAWNQYLTA